MTLGYSRKSVRLLVFRSSSRIWAELHEKAFRRLGGSPHTIVLDNLREGVLSPDIYDPKVKLRPERHAGSDVIGIGNIPECFKRKGVEKSCSAVEVHWNGL